MMIPFLIKKHSKKPVMNMGFTLVELIVVILILAIIGVYASSKYMGASRFSSAAAQEQVLSILRQVQITAMQVNGSNDHDDCRLIVMRKTQFGVSQSCPSRDMSSAVLSDYSKGSNQQQLEQIQLNYAFNSANGVTSVSELTFDLLGRPIMATSSAATSLCTISDCRITINTPSVNESRSVCINSEGFIYRSRETSGCRL
ncbi:prepilin-type N-terminal cleavage/methylation domain-containing protein [Aliivibrio sp. S2TY2]|nr:MULTISPECIES: prepilin-type N-terminal cleavage/methylation domain-containing protein [unclassified Aliivibrio]MDD9175569.1 prepilin-type N-terminal cleavage/methylation domain-containing protein [Aliivibrio sp. S3TY1]MDD9192648.1 prepilin-type N-terminal cleavage/methylation domain-containing protein [Aliivibrio sp. S2TY2]